MPHTKRDSVVDGRGGPIKVRDYLPDRPAAGTALLWIHGGGFTSGGLDQKESDAPARYLADRGRRVRTIDYRLAPRLRLRGKVEPGADKPGRFPAAHHDVLDVAQALTADTGAPVSLGGASAGANLAAAATLATRDQGLTLPRSLVFAYGVFHAVLPEDTTVEGDLHGPLAKWAFNPKMTARMNRNYVGDDDLLEPGYAFPGGADLLNFPPTLSIDAKNDRLRRSGASFAHELQKAEVEVKQIVIPAMHAFLNTPRKPAFSTAMAWINNWLEHHD